jgi:two-component system, cell cycle sensor histidine kinase and response regulator CckA
MVEKPTYEATGLGKNGEEFPIRLEARNIPYKGKQVRTVEFRDITEQKKAEMEREKLQAWLPFMALSNRTAASSMFTVRR